MTRSLRRTLAATAVAVLIHAPGCRRAGPEIQQVSQSEVAASLGHGDAPFLLDVRTPAEFASGHVPGAVNIPQDSLASHLQELTGLRGREIVVYCERGPRSAKAAALLVGAGFSAVRHLTGDMAGWRSAGLPTAK